MQVDSFLDRQNVLCVLEFNSFLFIRETIELKSYAHRRQPRGRDHVPGASITRSCPVTRLGLFSCNIFEYNEVMNVSIEPTWKEALKDEFALPYFKELSTKVRDMYLGSTPVYPPPKQIFNAFELCPFDAVKVVILGQDPYHGPGQAHGLSFSVEDGVPLPPSLQNIYKELRDDLGVSLRTSGNLTDWARQGVLLLNATLTVYAHQAGSHQKMGWERFTDAVIQKLSDEREHLVFILWGRYAQEKGNVIDTSKHLVLKSAHPSPLSAYNGFFGSKPFSTTNAYLNAHSIPPIVW